jgi:hypothetical protein
MVSLKAEVSDSDDEMPLGRAKTQFSDSKVATTPEKSSLSPSSVIVKKLPMPVVNLLPSPNSGLGLDFAEPVRPDSQKRNNSRLISPSSSSVIIKKPSTPAVQPLTSPWVVKSRSKPRGQSEIVRFKSQGALVLSQVANYYVGQVVAPIQPDDHAVRLKALIR